jgi:hypothetical protein
MDLNPLDEGSPPAFHCSGLPNGSHPHPSDCASFFICRQGEGQEGPFTCPQPLLFDPILKTCNSPQLVECFVSCEGRANGPSPHPNDCDRKFLLCNVGGGGANSSSTATVDVQECPEPLLFDPTRLVCDLPESVHCNNNTAVYPIPDKKCSTRRISYCTTSTIESCRLD